MLLAKRGMRILKNVEEYRAVFGFPIIDYYRRLGFDFEKESYDVLANEWASYYDAFCCESPLCDGVYNVIKIFKEQGKKQIILSMAEKGRLFLWLKRLGLFEYFDEIIGLDNIYAESKIGLARKWFESNNEKNSVIIGDTEHDFAVAKELGVDCILVCGGHQNRKTLEKCDVPVLNSVKELLYRKDI